VIDWTILRSSIQLRRVSLMWYSIGLTLYGWMMVAFFPLVGANPEYMEMAEEMFSDEMMAAFGGTGLEFNTLGGFLSIEYLSLMWIFIAGAAVIMFASSVLGGAVDDGTMEVTLSQPVSRTSVVLTNYVGMVVYATVLSLVTVLSIYLAGFLHDVDIPLDAMMLLFVACVVFLLAIGGFSFLMSSMSSGKGRATSISLGVLVTMYLADIVGSINSDYSWLSDISLFHYWAPNEIIDDMTVAPETWLVFGIAAAVFFAVGVYAFQKRDVA